MAYKTPENERAYKRAWYEENKHVYYERNKKRREEKRDYIHQLKTDTPCVDCGVNYHYCQMDFDHVSGDKSSDVSRLQGYGWSTILEEIAKCDIVCSNCHRLRTFMRSLESGVIGNTQHSGC